MKYIISRDVKSKLTKTAFNVPPHLIGRSLASPKRRLAALLIDLIIASTLASMIGLNLLIVIGISFILPMLVKPLRKKISRRSQITLFILGIIVLFITVGIKTGKGLYQRFIVPLSTGEFQSTDDSLAVNKMMTEIKSQISSDTTGETQNEIKEMLTELEKENIQVSEYIDPDYLVFLDSLGVKEDSLAVVENFYLAYKNQDSAKIVNYTPSMQKIVAGALIEQKNQTITTLAEKLDDTEDELVDAWKQLSNPSFIRTFRAFLNDVGLSIGWVAFYFVFCWFLFDGKSPGKKLLHIQIIRMNGHPLKLWYCFERFSGYAAGLATGLLGFLQIYWDDNRQCIHDKIASTVVIDLKPRKKR